jgi:hypothetical protein
MPSKALNAIPALPSTSLAEGCFYLNHEKSNPLPNLFLKR